MDKREFASYILNRIEKRHYGGEPVWSILSWMNSFADQQANHFIRTGDVVSRDNSVILCEIRDAYYSDGLRGCREYIRERL